MAADPTITQTDVPPSLQPYTSAALTNLANLTNPYNVPYFGLSGYGQATGRSPFTGFNPLQMQAAQGAATLGPSEQTAQASDIAAGAANQAAGAGANYFGMTSNPMAVGAFMSPYMQNVVDTQKQQAIQDYGRGIPSMIAGGIRAGARGGTREALMQSEAQRNLQNQLQGIQSTGLQNAYSDALKNMQYGSTLGLQGAQAAGSAANILGNLGQNQFDQYRQAALLQNQLGGGIQDYANKIGLAQYQDWQNQMNYPLTAVQTMLGGLRQIPVGQSQFAAPTSTWNQIGGALGGLGSLYSAIFGNS